MWQANKQRIEFVFCCWLWKWRWWYQIEHKFNKKIHKFKHMEDTNHRVLQKSEASISVLNQCIIVAASFPFRIQMPYILWIFSLGFSRTGKLNTQKLHYVHNLNHLLLNRVLFIFILYIVSLNSMKALVHCVLFFIIWIWNEVRALKRWIFKVHVKKIKLRAFCK